MKNILVWAHRGASGIMPENTLPAFAKAVELGADGVELDIQMSADGEIVVIHDEMVDRTSDGKGWVKDFTLEQLRQLDVSYGHKELGHVCIPTMREVFELLKPTELTINIELKTGILDYPGMEEKILILTREYGFEDRVIYSSFNHYSILKIQKLDPSAKTAFLYADGPIDMPEYGKKHHVNALHPAMYNIRMPDFMKKCKEYGLDVNVWTVNNEEYTKLCIQAGVNAIITNYPDLVRRVIQSVKDSPFRKLMEEQIHPWMKDHITDGYFHSKDGLNIHYYKAVHPQEKAAVVMVHGFCEFFGKYHEVAYRFYQAGYSVFFIELRGHGKSERTFESSDQKIYVSDFREYEEDLDAFVHQVVKKESVSGKYILYSHSMGGAVSALYLEDYPKVFRCAVLSSPMLKINYGKIPQTAVDVLSVYSKVRNMAFEYAPGQGSFNPNASLESSSAMDQDRYEYQMNQRIADRDYQTSGGTYGWAVAAQKACDRIMDHVRNITTPVLLCQAGKDRLVRLEGQDAFDRLCDKVTLIRFPESRHEIYNATDEIREPYFKAVISYFDAYAGKK